MGSCDPRLASFPLLTFLSFLYVQLPLLDVAFEGVREAVIIGMH